MKIADLVPGDIYVIKKVIDIEVFIQVAIGTDCGVFIGDWAKSSVETPIFQVVVNQRDLKRNWKKMGSRPLSIDMKTYKTYGEKEIGYDLYYKVTLADLDRRNQIELEEYSKIEPLGVWETSHILERVYKFTAEK